MARPYVLALVHICNKSGGNYVWPVRSGQSGSLGSSIISLPRTGQTTCYDATGSSIACAGTGQDGELQMGAAWPGTRFADNGYQTVSDNLTGFIWTKDGKTPGLTACGFGGGKTWQGALDYVKCLNTNNYLGHNDWRLPNRKELQSLVYAGQSAQDNWLNIQVIITFRRTTIGRPIPTSGTSSAHGLSICTVAPCSGASVSPATTMRGPCVPDSLGHLLL